MNCRSLVLAGLLALGRLAPRRDRVTAARGAAFAAAVRVVDRVHGDAANVRACGPASACGRPCRSRSFMWSGFDTAPTVAMQRPCTMRSSPEFEPQDARSRRRGRRSARRCRPSARSGRPCRASSRHCGRWCRPGCCERHGVAGLHVDLLAGDHGVAGRQALRREDVGQLAVGVLDQRDEGGAVRIVLEPLDRRRHVALAALEVDDAVGAACGRRRGSAR